MKRSPIILFLLISVTALCQETSYTVDTGSGSELAMLTQNNSQEYNKAYQFDADPIQLITEMPLRSELDYSILPLISRNVSVVRNRIFPDWDPVFSVFLKRNILYSGKYIINSGFSNSFRLAVSFGAGLRLPLSSKVLLDVGIKDEFGVLSNRKLYLKDYINNNSRSIGLTLGVSYKM